MPVAGHHFLLKTWGTHNLPSRKDNNPCTTPEDQREVAGASEAMLLGSGGSWHVMTRRARGSL